MLTIVDNVQADAIGMGAMEPALMLADWYVNEAVRLQRAGRTDARLLRAQQLLDWMRGRLLALILLVAAPSAAGLERHRIGLIAMPEQRRGERPAHRIALYTKETRMRLRAMRDLTREVKELVSIR